MKLLIVDDQPGVTEGLCHGVNWAQLGFSQVQAVNSVREARAAMLNTVPDVMLCDIEMPEETGLELFKWVKKQGFATRCIFLTAHAKFSYAQEAMHLGAFDYIIQPAPYSEISQVTARAVKDVQASRDQKELTQMGRAFNEQAQAITAQAIRAFLSRQHNERDVKTLQGLGIFPRSDRNGYLVLIHILRWEPTADHWEKQLLAVALNNIAAETFAVHSELSPIASVDEHSYAMLLQNTAGEEMDLEGIMRQLMYISNVAQQYLRCSMAFYLDDKLPVPKMPDLWEKLLHMQGENVTLRSGVFRLKEAPRHPHLPGYLHRCHPLWPEKSHGHWLHRRHYLQRYPVRPVDCWRPHNNDQQPRNRCIELGPLPDHLCCVQHPVCRLPGYFRQYRNSHDRRLCRL